MKDIDRMCAYSGTVDGKHVGQPYDKQWWMHYFTVKSHPQDIRFKNNIFTGALFVFTRPEEGNRWNEPGYGWGTWKRI